MAARHQYKNPSTTERRRIWEKEIYGPMMAYMGRNRMSNSDMADLIGCSQHTLARWINGEGYPSYEKIGQIREAIGLSDLGPSDQYDPQGPVR